MIKWLRDKLTTPKPVPDLPGAIIPGWVIDSFPLLSRMPQFIGFDLRHLTQDKLIPQEIPFLSAIDGLKYEGVAAVHHHYGIVANSGISPILKRPSWYLGIVAMNTDRQYLLDMSQRLNAVYDSRPANRLTSLHIQAAESMDNAMLSWWEESKYLADERCVMKCKLHYHSLTGGRNIVLRYQIGGDL